MLCSPGFQCCSTPLFCQQISTETLVSTRNPAPDRFTMHQTSYLLSQTPRLLSAPQRSSSPATLARAREFLARNAPRSDLDAAAAVAMYPGGYAPSHDTGLGSAAQLMFGGIPFENNRSAIHRGQLHHPASNTDQALQAACCAPRSMMGSSTSASSPASPASLHGRIPSSLVFSSLQLRCGGAAA